MVYHFSNINFKMTTIDISESNTPMATGHSSTERMSLKGGGDTCQSVLVIVFSFLFVMGGLFVGVWQFITYVRYKDDECEKPLAEWCLVSGCFFCFVLLVNLLTPEENKPVANYLMGILALANMIVGSIFAFSMDHDNRDCPDGLFHFVFYLLIVDWSLFGLSIVVNIILSLAVISRQL